MADEVTEQQETTEELQWATADDLPSEPFAVVDLPVLKRKVRVRYLGQSDVAKIGYLPELRAFAEMMAEKMLSEREGEQEELNAVVERLQNIELERIRYSTLIVHAFVIGGEGPRVYCPECHLEHGPVLWTREQAELLEIPDIQAIVSTAEREEALQAIVPFSASTENVSEASASTGA